MVTYLGHMFGCQQQPPFLRGQVYSEGTLDSALAFAFGQIFENADNTCFLRSQIIKERIFGEYPSVFAGIAIDLIILTAQDADIACTNLVVVCTLIVVTILQSLKLVKIDFHTAKILNHRL